MSSEAAFSTAFGFRNATSSRPEIDLDRLQHLKPDEVPDLQVLQEALDDLVFSALPRVTHGEPSSSDPAFVSLFELGQLTLEHLLASQEALIERLAEGRRREELLQRRASKRRQYKETLEARIDIYRDMNLRRAWTVRQLRRAAEEASRRAFEAVPYSRSHGHIPRVARGGERAGWRAAARKFEPKAGGGAAGGSGGGPFGGGGGGGGVRSSTRPATESSASSATAGARSGEAAKHGRLDGLQAILLVSRHVGSGGSGGGREATVHITTDCGTKADKNYASAGRGHAEAKVGSRSSDSSRPSISATGNYRVDEMMTMIQVDRNRNSRRGDGPTSRSRRQVRGNRTKGSNHESSAGSSSSNDGGDSSDDESGGSDLQAWDLQAWVARSTEQAWATISHQVMMLQPHQQSTPQHYHHSALWSGASGALPAVHQTKLIGSAIGGVGEEEVEEGQVVFEGGSWRTLSQLTAKRSSSLQHPATAEKQQEQKQRIQPLGTLPSDTTSSVNSNLKTDAWSKTRSDGGGTGNMATAATAASSSIGNGSRTAGSSGGGSEGTATGFSGGGSGGSYEEMPRRRVAGPMGGGWTVGGGEGMADPRFEADKNDDHRQNHQQQQQQQQRQQRQQQQGKETDDESTTGKENQRSMGARSEQRRPFAKSLSHLPSSSSAVELAAEAAAATPLDDSHCGRIFRNDHDEDGTEGGGHSNNGDCNRGKAAGPPLAKASSAVVTAEAPAIAASAAGGGGGGTGAADAEPNATGAAATAARPGQTTTAAATLQAVGTGSAQQGPGRASEMTSAGGLEDDYDSFTADWQHPPHVTTARCKTGVGRDAAGRKGEA